MFFSPNFGTNIFNIIFTGFRLKKSIFLQIFQIFLKSKRTGLFLINFQKINPFLKVFLGNRSAIRNRIYSEKQFLISWCFSDFSDPNFESLTFFLALTLKDLPQCKLSIFLKIRKYFKLGSKKWNHFWTNFLGNPVFWKTVEVLFSVSREQSVKNFQIKKIMIFVKRV